jgi:hypothetical protein
VIAVDTRPVRLVRRASPAQFTLAGVDALAGGMTGQERTGLPLLGTRVSRQHACTAALTCIAASGVARA